MRKVSCKLCLDAWCGRKGHIHDWYQEHLNKHGLVEPKREEGESVDDWLHRLVTWRKQYFEDSLYGEEVPSNAGMG